MIDFSTLTWTCHVCARERPDSKISVYSTTQHIRGIAMQHNVRYCNDNPECLEGAKKVLWVRGDS